MGNQSSRRDIVVIGGSAGGIEALKEILSRLPHDFAASVFIVVHQSPSSPGTLAHVFSNASRFDVRTAEDNTPFQTGVAYVAPPDFHLTIEQETIRVIQGPKEHHHRPAIDTLFRSAAITHGPRVIGVILSGYLDDGSAGLAAIKSQGGIAIVQHPADALASGMPEAALRAVKADHVARLADISAILLDRTRDDDETLRRGAGVRRLPGNR